MSDYLTGPLCRPGYQCDRRPALLCCDSKSLPLSMTCLSLSQLLQVLDVEIDWYLQPIMERPERRYVAIIDSCRILHIQPQLAGLQILMILRFVNLTKPSWASWLCITEHSIEGISNGTRIKTRGTTGR